MSDPSKKLWIGNLSYKVVKDDLDVLFRQYGTIVDIKLLDKGPHVYAFVEYEKQDSAIEAYEKLQSRELKGNAMKIEFANGRKRQVVFIFLEQITETEIVEEETVIHIRSEKITEDAPEVIAMTSINRNLKVLLLLSTFTFLGHRRRSSSSESSRHRKISKQNRNKSKSPDHSGLSNS